MGEWSGFKDSLNLIRSSTRHSDVVDVKTMRESFHHELLAGPPQFFTTLSKLRNQRNIAEHQILGVNLRSRTVLVADDQRGTAYVFEAAILDPQLVRVIGIDGNRGGNVLELGTN